MKKLKISFILILFILALLSNSQVFASNISFKKVEYSENFSNWLKLSDEEKKNTIAPRMYDVPFTNILSTSPFRRFKMLRSSIADTKYSLKDYIPDNLSIRNQYNTNSCWAFATLSSLETNLALTDYKNGLTSHKVYDFSERHMNYFNSDVFANNQINKEGYKRSASAGGNWFNAISYLTNGGGAINETDMPFENNSNLINLSEIQNKTVTSQVHDTIDFANYNTLTPDKAIEVKNQIKQHIQNYGAVYANIHGNSSSSIGFTCYNDSTGAKFCDSTILHPIDHAVSIVGWDDNYSIDNFAEGAKPLSAGAWIIRNSWGEREEHDLLDFKREVFELFKDNFISIGCDAPEKIPNEFFTNLGYTIEDNMVYKAIGDNGFIYVSYEDSNVSGSLFGITKASSTVNYDNIYQYDKFYPAGLVEFESSQLILCNVFDKKSSAQEFLTQVSLFCPETYTCKVFVNPNGTSVASNDMKEVALKSGKTETLSMGYHSLELATPIEITGNNFAVAVAIQSTRNETSIQLECKPNFASVFDNVKLETNKCFIGSGNNIETAEWCDLSKLSDLSSELINGDSSLKAFTTNKPQTTYLTNIEVTTPPTKTSYFEGENFDKSGMVVKAHYSDNTSKVLDNSSYNITNGNNLKANQTIVTITYENKTTNLPITVKTKPSSSLPDDDKKPSVPEIKAENSKLTDAKCNVKNAKAYYYSKDSKKDYTLITVEINNITLSSGNDKLEYYYCLSANSNKPSMDNWIKISNVQVSDNKLQFVINSKEVTNFNEISNDDVVYLYLKEVAILGGNQSVAISSSMKLEMSDNMETYVDDVKKENVGANNSTNSPSKDTSIAPDKLPQTGIKFTYAIIFIIICIATVLYIRYIRLNKAMK